MREKIIAIGLAAIVSASTAHGQVETFHDTAGSPLVGGIELGGGRVFNFTTCTATPSITWLQGTPTGTGSTRTLHFRTPVGCPPEDQIVTLGVDPLGNPLWFDGDRKLKRLSHSAEISDTPEVLTTSPTGSGAITPSSRISAFGDRIFWSTVEAVNDTGFRSTVHVLLPNGARTTAHVTEPVVGALDASITELQAISPNAFIYLTGSGRLALVYEQAGTWLAHSISPASVDGFFFHGDRIFYSEHAPTRVLIRSLRLGNPPFLQDPQVHFSESRATNPSLRLNGIAADAAAVYWFRRTVGDSISSGQIYRARVGLSGVSEGAITGILGGSPRDLVSDGRHLYWASGNNKILRLPVGASLVEIDFAATGIEAIQTVQSLANDVPLVARKRTLVRLYGRIADNGGSAGGAWVFPMALLHGTAGNGDPLPGSPLFPMYPGSDALTTAGHDRTLLRGGPAFELPPSWVRGGEIVLRGEINPTGAFNESNSANNSITLKPDFIDKSPICLSFHPLRTTTGTSDLFGTAEVFTRAETLLPTTDLRVYNSGSDPIERWDWGSWSYKAYDLASSSQVSDALCEIFDCQLWTDDPDDCEDANAVIHSFSVYNHTDGFAFGTASLGSPELIFAPHGRILRNRGSGSPDYRPDFRLNLPINSYVGGVTLAHELAHNYGRLHVDCPPGAPKSADPNYPYDSCNFGSLWPGGHYGWDPMSGRWFDADSAGDLMSYSRLRWPSPYTYTAVFNQISRIPVSSNGRAPRGNGGGASGKAIVRGSFLTKDNAAQIIGAVEMDPATLERAERAVGNGDTTRFSMLTLDADKKVIGSHEVTAKIASSHEDPDPETGLFFAIIDCAPGIQTLQLVEKNIPENVFGQLVGGGSAPKVDFLGTPSVSGDTLEVAWRGDDTDGDLPRHSLRYSNDGGTSWLSLISATPLEEFKTSVDRLPGGTNCRVQIMTSDGVLTTKIVSNAFTVAEKAPDVPQLDDCPSGILYAESGRELRVGARAYDVEDGPLDGKSLEWRLDNIVVGSGTDLVLPPLPGGTYALELSATDSSGQSNSATWTVVADPKHTEDATSPVIFDGFVEEAAWAADTHPIRLGGGATLLAVAGADGFWFALAGLPNGKDDDERASLALMLSPQPFATPFFGDLRIEIFADGRVITSKGAGGGASPWLQNAIAQIDARIQRGASHWSAELFLPASLVPPAINGISRLHISHIDGEATLAQWPEGSATNPTHWALLMLAPDPDDLTDTDADGLPDAWEREHFGDLLNDGGADSDGDGQIDAAEWLAGTDPRDAGDLFKATPSALAGGGVKLSWPSLDRRAYSVLRSTNLVTFTPIAEQLAPTNETMTFTDPNPPAGEAFYKVLIHDCR